MAISTPTYYTLKYLGDITHASVLRCSNYIQVVYFFLVVSHHFEYLVVAVHSRPQRRFAWQRAPQASPMPDESLGFAYKVYTSIKPGNADNNALQRQLSLQRQRKIVENVAFNRSSEMWLLQFLLNQSKYIIFCGHLPSSHAFCGVLDHTRRLPECRYIVNVPQYLKWHRRRLRSAPPRETSLRPRVDCYH